MKNTFRKVQFLANMATIIIAVLLCVIVVKQFVSPKDEKTIAAKDEVKAVSAVPIVTPEAAAKINPVGKAVPLPEVDWKKNGRTLVLYLSNT